MCFLALGVEGEVVREVQQEIEQAPIARAIERRVGLRVMAKQLAVRNFEQRQAIVPCCARRASLVQLALLLVSCCALYAAARAEQKREQNFVR